jgi:CheY-like chemotaxis protein
MPELNKIILLADDDPEDQEILEEEILKLEPSVKLRKVGSGKEALDYLLNCSDGNLPCLIILDYAMPVLNAAEVLGEIATKDRFENIPKVVWSSSKQPEHVKSCIDKGAIGYFAKPNKMAELKSIARQMLDLCYDGKEN